MAAQPAAVFGEQALAMAVGGGFVAAHDGVETEVPEG
jgi:hypothetical protein